MNFFILFMKASASLNYYRGNYMLFLVSVFCKRPSNGGLGHCINNRQHSCVMESSEAQESQKIVENTNRKCILLY